MSNVTRLTSASQHPDPIVRRAENFALALQAMLLDLTAGKISAEILGHSYQKFCVDELRKVRDEEREKCAKEVECEFGPPESDFIRAEAAWRLRYMGRFRNHIESGKMPDEFRE